MPQKLNVASGQVEKTQGSHAVSGEESDEPQLRFHAPGKKCLDDVKTELMERGKSPGAPVLCVHSCATAMRYRLLLS